MLHRTVQEQTSMFMNGLRSIEKLYDEYAKLAGLTYFSFLVLNAIYEAPGGCTQKILCEKTHLPKQSVNVIIHSFWEKGYVEMKEQDSDRRNKTIQFSASGREYAEQIVGNLLKSEAKVVSQFSHKQQQVIIDLMQKWEIGLRESIKTLERSNG